MPAAGAARADASGRHAARPRCRAGGLRPAPEVAVELTPPQRDGSRRRRRIRQRRQQRKRGREVARDHLRGRIPGVSYRPRPRTTSTGDPMLEPTDFSESSWTGPGMMEPMYPPAPSTPPAPAPMKQEPMGAPRPRPAKKKRKAARPKAKRKAAKKRPKARAKRRGKAKRKKAARKRRR